MELVSLFSQTSLVRRAAGSIAGSEDVAITRSLATGEQLGRYEVLEPRGAGAMGTVYAARDTQLGRLIAIKLVRTTADDRAQVALLREAQALARVTHPNVLTVYDVGAFDGNVFLAAELVEGESLAAWSATPRPWRTVVRVYLDAARGLAATHQAGLVHRDFKPANVLVGTDGRVRVCDFGLARGADAPIAVRELVGTPGYMAPEQRRGEPADSRSDQFAFCVALDEATSHVRVPRWLSATVARGRRAIPSERFPSMTALIAALERGLSRRRWWQLGAAATVIAAGAFAADRQASSELAAQCPEPTLDAWDDTRRRELASVFAETGAPYAEVVSQRVTRVFDGFAVEWRAQHRAACLAFRVHATEDENLYDRRIGYLERSRAIFEAVVDGLGTLQRDQLGPETERALRDLPDLEVCLRPKAVAPNPNATVQGTS